MNFNLHARSQLIKEIVTRALGAAVFGLVTFLWAKLTAPAGDSGVLRFLQAEVSAPLWAYLLSYVALGVLIPFLFKKTMVKVRRGREASMSQNVKLLQERVADTAEEGTIRSTRFASWPLAEAAPFRTAFRHEIDNAVLKEERTVRRIWNIKNEEDARRLQEILKRYSGHVNKSIRVFFNIPDHILPELLVINERVASLSFPQRRNPGAVEACIVLRHPETVKIVEEYFENLWNYAEKALEAGNVVQSTLSRLNDYAPTHHATTPDSSHR